MQITNAGVRRYRSFRTLQLRKRFAGRADQRPFNRSQFPGTKFCNELLAAFLRAKMKEFNEIVQERTRESQRDCGFGSEIAPGSFLAVCPSKR